MTKLHKMMHSVLKIDSASHPKYRPKGNLYPALEAAFATLIMYYPERKATGEMNAVLVAMREAFSSVFGSTLSTFPDETLTKWGNLIAQRFREENSRIIKHMELGGDLTSEFSRIALTMEGQGSTQMRLFQELQTIKHGMSKLNMGSISKSPMMSPEAMRGGGDRDWLEPPEVLLPKTATTVKVLASEGSLSAEQIAELLRLEVKKVEATLDPKLDLSIAVVQLSHEYRISAEDIAEMLEKEASDIKAILEPPISTPQRTPFSPHGSHSGSAHGSASRRASMAAWQQSGDDEMEMDTGAGVVVPPSALGPLVQSSHTSAPNEDVSLKDKEAGEYFLLVMSKFQGLVPATLSGAAKKGDTHRVGLLIDLFKPLAREGELKILSPPPLGGEEPDGGQRRIVALRLQNYAIGYLSSLFDEVPPALARGKLPVGGVETRVNELVKANKMDKVNKFPEGALKKWRDEFEKVEIEKNDGLPLPDSHRGPMPWLEGAAKKKRKKR